MGIFTDDYVFEGGFLKQCHQLESGSAIVIGAKDVRQTPTGPHAFIGINYGRRTLAYDTFNIARREDRTRLANAASKALKASAPIDWKEFPDATMQSVLDGFCIGLWDEWLGINRSIMLSGGDSLEPLRFWIPPYVMHGGGTIIFGPKGSGKTYIGLVMGLCVQYGIRTFWNVEQAEVLFVQLERSEYSFGRRIALAARALGLPQNTKLRTLVARGKSLADVIDAIKRNVEQDGVKLVIVDSISRSGAGSLTEDKTANSVMDALNAAAPSYIALGHTSHDGNDNPEKAHVFGSIHFANAADILVQITKQRGGIGVLGVQLHVTEANDTPVGHTDLFRFEFDEVGLSAISRAQESEFVDLAAIKDSKAPTVERLKNILASMTLLDAGDAALMLSVSRASIVNYFKTDSRFVFVRKEGKKDLYGLRSDQIEAPRW